MTALAELDGRNAIAELLRMALRRLAAQPFREMASIEGYAQLQRSHDGVLEALRALGEDPEQPSHEECDEDRPTGSVLSPLERAVRHVHHAETCACLAGRRWCCDQMCCPPLPPPSPRWFEVQPPAPVVPVDRPVVCLACGEVFAEGSLVASRDAYLEHLANGCCRPGRPTGWSYVDPFFTLAETSAGCGRKR